MNKISAINNVTFGAMLQTRGLSNQKKNIIDNQVKAQFERITSDYPEDVLELYTNEGKLGFCTRTHEKERFEENSGTFSKSGSDKLVKLPKEEIAEKLKDLLVAAHKSNSVYKEGAHILGVLENFLGDSENYSVGDEMDEAYGTFWQAFHEKSAVDIEKELSKDPVLKTITVA